MITPAEARADIIRQANIAIEHAHDPSWDPLAIAEGLAQVMKLVGAELAEFFENEVTKER